MQLAWMNTVSDHLRLSHCFGHCAAGIEIQPAAVRVLVLSRSGLGTPTLRLEHIAQRPLPSGAVVGVELTDVMTIAKAIVDALFMSKRRPVKVSRAVMALPNAAILFGTTSVTELALTSTYLDTLETAVRAEAERLFRIEATELALDWFQPMPATGLERQTSIADNGQCKTSEANGARHPAKSHSANHTEADQQRNALMIAAAPQHYVEAYLEVAAQAGLQLTALDEENAAVLRACRFAAQHTLPAEALYSVIWLGIYQSYAWFVRGHQIEQELFFSSLDLAKPVIIDALQYQTQAETPQQVFITGELETLEALDLNLEEIGTALHCQACVFDARAYCQVDKSVYPNYEPSASFALAFGLALRGVFE